MSFQIRQPRLFPVDKYQAERDYTPGVWEKGEDIVWHSSGFQYMPEDQGHSSASTGGGFHVGTKAAAEDRVWNTTTARVNKVLHPLRLRGSMVLPPDHDPDSYESLNTLAFRTVGYGSIDANESVDARRAVRLSRGEHGHMAWGDEAANYSQAARRAVEVHGQTVPYVNEAEDAGSVSYRSPRENLHTWAESVAADPNAPNWAKAASEQGYDLSHPVNTMDTEHPREGGQQLSMNLGPAANSTTVGYDREAVDRHVAALEYARNTKPRLRRGREY